MKVYISPRAQELLDDPMTGPFMKPAVDEAIYYGLDAVKKEPGNLFYERCESTLWWENFCPLIVYHNKAGDYAMVLEKPVYAHFPHIPESYFEKLLPLCKEINIA